MDKDLQDLVLNIRYWYLNNRVMFNLFSISVFQNTVLHSTLARYGSMLEGTFSIHSQDYCSTKADKCIFWYASQCTGIIHTKFFGLSASYVCLAVLLLYKKLIAWPYLNGIKAPLLLIPQIWTIYWKHMTVCVGIWVPATGVRLQTSGCSNVQMLATGRPGIWDHLLGWSGG